VPGAILRSGEKSTVPLSNRSMLPLTRRALRVARSTSPYFSFGEKFRPRESASSRSDVSVRMYQTARRLAPTSPR
jgi:hypothetical protein